MILIKLLNIPCVLRKTDQNKRECVSSVYVACLSDENDNSIFDKCGASSSRNSKPLSSDRPCLIVSSGMLLLSGQRNRMAVRKKRKKAASSYMNFWSHFSSSAVM